MNVIEAEILALDRMEEHGLFDELWHFDFEHCKRTLGRCHYTPKKITLSKWYVEFNNESEVEDTILHEIAHALSYIRHGSKGIGHGGIWKGICREIGAIPKSCSKGNLVKPKDHYKYIDDCACGITYKRHRKSDFRIYRCPKCKQPLFNRQEKSEWLSASALLEEILGESA
jgi:predicted SprT family Zn-dependent metalloprotease